MPRAVSRPHSGTWTCLVDQSASSTTGHRILGARGSVGPLSVPKRPRLDRRAGHRGQDLTRRRPPVRERSAYPVPMVRWMVVGALPNIHRKVIFVGCLSGCVLLCAWHPACSSQFSASRLSQGCFPLVSRSVGHIVFNSAAPGIPVPRLAQGRLVSIRSIDGRAVLCFCPAFGAAEVFVLVVQQHACRRLLFKS